jgi:hypothetical protein
MALREAEHPNFVKLAVVKSQYEGGQYGVALIADDGRLRQLGRDDFVTPDDAIKNLEIIFADLIGRRP